MGFGKLSEINISDGIHSATYLVLFLREDLGVDYTEQMASYLTKVMGDCENRDTSVEGSTEQRREYDLGSIQIALEQFLHTLGYRTMLDQSDLQSLGLSKGILPDFYQKAVAADIAKIIMF